jgi:hypothetical protein
MSEELVIQAAIIGVIAAMAIGVLKSIGFEYFRAVCWHNLRLEVQYLQRDQESRLRELQGEVDILVDEAPDPAFLQPPAAMMDDATGPDRRKAA